MTRSLAPRRRYYLHRLAATLLVSTCASQSLASTADDCVDICGASGACSIGALWDIVPGSTIDCSGRDVTVGAYGTLKVTDGSFTLKARDLTVSSSSGTITAVEGSANMPGEI